MRGRRDIILLGIATLVIVACVGLVGGKYFGGKGGSAPKPVVVEKVTPEFDLETVKRLAPFFSIKFDLKNLGRPDPFAGI
jgi:hypothetical protein